MGLHEHCYLYIVHHISISGRRNADTKNINSDARSVWPLTGLGIGQ